MKKVFLSFSYRDENIKNEVKYVLEKENIQILDTITEVNIGEFNAKAIINDADCAIIFMSDNYLHSISCLDEGAFIIRDELLRNNCLIILDSEINILKLQPEGEYFKYWLDYKKNIKDNLELKFLSDKYSKSTQIQLIKRAQNNILDFYLSANRNIYIQYTEFKKNPYYYISKLFENISRETSFKDNKILYQAKKVVNDSIHKNKYKSDRNIEYTQIEKSLAYKCFISWILTQQGKLNIIFKYNTLLEYCIEFISNVICICDINKKGKEKIEYYDYENEVTVWENRKIKNNYVNFETESIKNICTFLNNEYEKSPNVFFDRNIISEIGIDVYSAIASKWICETSGESISKLIDEKLKIKESIIEHKHQIFLPGYSLDDSNGEDKLNIMKDVNALATLISYKNLNPPLAIGIFGKWGAGKSFFMDKLKLKTEELSRQKNNFCNDIVHVKFNAWHYSDTNLWASLVEKIFNELTKYAKTKGKEKEARQILFEELESSRNAIFQIQNKLNNINASKEELMLKKTEFENERNKKNKELRSIKLKDINYIVKNNEYIKNNINKLKIELDDLVIENFSLII